jgi:6-pyruvoyltetrahydropterin/6-carboxytetrahydropterin synthase
VRLSRRYRFSASHRLHARQLSAEANAELYGKCNYPYGHGHNYAVEITVRGPVQPETGVVANVQALDALVKRHVLDAYEHRNLNTLPEFSGTVPTSENLGLEIQRRLASSWHEAFPEGKPALDRVCVEETERNRFEIGLTEKD